MTERDRTANRTNEGADQKHRLKQHDSQIPADLSHAWDQGLLSFTETPFLPRMNEHVSRLSNTPSNQERHGYILRLHRTYGNKYVQRLLDTMNFQAKLTVNDPGDVYEQEADKVADKVTGTEVQRQEEEEEVQMKSTDGQLSQVSENLESSIDSERSGGQYLDKSVRADLEPQMGYEFSNVRVHTDARANKLSGQLQAKAFTTGNDIFFKEGAYQPATNEGKKLIAHELTHVVQQSGSVKPVQRDEGEETTESTSAGGEAGTESASEAGGRESLSGAQGRLWVTLVVTPINDVYETIVNEENPDYDAIQQTLNNVHRSIADFSGGVSISPEMQEAISSFRQRVFSCYMMAHSHASGGEVLGGNIASVAQNSRNIAGDAELPALP